MYIRMFTIPSSVYNFGSLCAFGIIVACRFSSGPTDYAQLSPVGFLLLIERTRYKEYKLDRQKENNRD